LPLSDFLLSVEDLLGELESDSESESEDLELSDELPFEGLLFAWLDPEP
jgi:hypothetical protein